MQNTNIKIKFIIKVILLLFLHSIVSEASNAIIIPEVSLNPKQFKLKSQNEYVETYQIDQQTIQETPVTTFTQLLGEEQSIVRLTQTTGNNDQVALSIRGFGENAAANSLILIDGFPLTNPSLLAPNANAIPLTDIEKIEITQGSQGVLWGNQAVGGVVNIITKRPQHFFLEGRGSVGNFHQLFSSLFVSDRFNNGVFLKTFASYNQTNHDREHNDQTDKNVGFVSGFDYSQGLLSLNLQQYRTTLQLPGGLTEEQYKNDPQKATNSKNFSHFQTQVYQLFNQHFLNDNWTLETRAGYQDTKGNGMMNVSYDRNDMTTIFNPRFKGSYENFKIITGFDGQFSEYDFTNLRVQEKAHIQQNNLFAEATIPFLTHWEWVLGERYAWQSNQIHPTPDTKENWIDHVGVTELGVAFHPNSNWQFFLRRSGNFRFPKANEETWLDLSIEKLKPQTGVSYEWGGEWKNEFQRFQWNLYELILQNEIAFNPTETDENPFGTYHNFEETRRQGITLTHDIHVTEKFSVNSQINYVDARFAKGSFSGNQIPAVPKWNGNAGIQYEWIPHWKTKYTAIYTGNRYASLDDANITDPIPGYWLQNFTLQYIKKSFDVSFLVANLFNQRYPLYTVYDDFSHEITYYPGAGRNYLLTMRIDIN